MPLSASTNTARQNFKGFCALGFVFLLVSISGCEPDASYTEIPREWKIDYKEKTIGELDRILGIPDEDANAKQFQNRIKKIPNGYKMLKVICPDRCAKSEVAVRVMFSTYKEGTYKPIYTATLLPEGERVN